MKTGYEKQKPSFPRLILRLRAVVLALGESAAPAWWKTEFMNETGPRFLERLYPRTTLSADEVRKPEAETVIEAEALVEPAVITTAADLDSWLAGIREKLAGLLKAGRRVKVMGSRKET